MGKTYSKKEAVSVAITAARLYRNNFAGKRLLFVVTDKHKNLSSLEVRFDASNFHHLTGLEITNQKWSRLDFYNFCIDGRLREADIEFTANGTTHQKLSVLSSAFKNPNLSATMLGNYNHSHPLLYTEKLVGGVKWALGFRDITGKGDYIPDTLLAGDIRNQIQNSYRIIATYIKKQDDPYFQKIIYKAKKIEYAKLCYPSDWGNRPILIEEPRTKSA